MMKTTILIKLTIIISLFICIIGCNGNSARPMFVTTNHPISEIIRELVGPTIEVHTLVPPYSSPHTYEPKPSDLFKVQTSEALFYVSPELDIWAEKLNAKNKIKIIDLIPKDMLLDFEPHEHDCSHEGHDHSHHKKRDKEQGEIVVYDPHFWTDPLTVKAILPALADTLAAIDPANAAKYRNNAQRFAGRLDVLHKQVSSELRPVMGKPVFLFHPSFRYLLKRYKLLYAGAIEEFPGKEPSPKYIAELTKRIEGMNAKAIFSEPQLPIAPAKTISETLGISLYTLDPLGGTNGRVKYSDIILYNARILNKALK